MMVCSACGATEILNSKCEKCGAWVSDQESWGTVRLESDSDATRPAPAQAPSPVASATAGHPRSTSFRTTMAAGPVLSGAKLAPDDGISPDQFTEEVTDVGEVFPRLATDAIVGENEPAGHGASEREEIVNLTEVVPTNIPADNSASAVKVDKCAHCGALMDLEKSRICDGCGVCAPKKPGASRQAVPRSRSTSKIVHRCRVCGYNVPADSPSCRNCGTPIS
jgi:hypothetical protein